MIRFKAAHGTFRHEIKFVSPAGAVQSPPNLTMETGMKLEIGAAAPEFDLQGSDGERYRLSELKGRAVVLAWFPRASTPG